MSVSEAFTAREVFARELRLIEARGYTDVPAGMSIDHMYLVDYLKMRVENMNKIIEESKHG